MEETRALEERSELDTKRCSFFFFFFLYNFVRSNSPGRIFLQSGAYYLYVKWPYILIISVVEDSKREAISLLTYLLHGTESFLRS
jgi:hypothetical protein